MDRCSSLECYRPAIAYGENSKLKYCMQCAIRVAEQGHKLVLGKWGALVPWAIGGDMICPHCKLEFKEGLIAIGYHCPKCKKSLREKE